MTDQTAHIGKQETGANTDVLSTPITQITQILEGTSASKDSPNLSKDSTIAQQIPKEVEQFADINQNNNIIDQKRESFLTQANDNILLDEAALIKTVLKFHELTLVPAPEGWESAKKIVELRNELKIGRVVHDAGVYSPTTHLLLCSAHWAGLSSAQEKSISRVLFDIAYQYAGNPKWPLIGLE